MISLSSVSFTYPNTTLAALTDISLSVRPGELVLCTGQSGCGKSTLIRGINGLIPYYSGGHVTGSVVIDGQSIAGVVPSDIAKKVGTLFQDPERQFFALTVGDEIAMALQWNGVPVAKAEQAVMNSAERMGITDLLAHSIFGLSEGQKQKVAIAALLAMGPKAIILDEPSANLDPESTLELAETLVQLKNSGLALLVVDHRLSWLRGKADRVLLMSEGQIIKEGSFEILDDVALREKYGLRAACWVDPRESLPLSSDGDLVTCQDLSFGYKKDKKIFHKTCLAFKGGEVVALLGPNGTGKTTLARVISGLEKPSEGSISIKGHIIRPKFLPAHVQVVFQNAGHQLRMQTVAKELEDAASLFTTKDIPSLVCEALEHYGLTHLAQRHPQSLSGGEKQRLAIACATIRSPQIVIFDEPTSGLDGKNMERVAARIREAADRGACAIVITHDLELMENVCTCKLDLSLYTGMESFSGVQCG